MIVRKGEPPAQRKTSDGFGTVDTVRCSDAGAACWPAGVPNAHHVSNESGRPCSFLIVGTRFDDDVCHYPDLGRTLYTEGETWRLVDAEGHVIKSGRTWRYVRP